MVTDKDGYIHIIEYLTAHLGLFETPSAKLPNVKTVIEIIEEELSEQIIMVCSQNLTLTAVTRNIIIREVDDILYDLEEVLSGVINNPATTEQHAFLKEFAGLIKNLFDTELQQ